MEQYNDAVEKLEIPEIRKRFENEEKRERLNDQETAQQRDALRKHYRDIQKAHQR